MLGEFETNYQKLNADQRQAVEYIEGPLLVIAGPGTGKTQLLSLRAANILKKTDVTADNILCLTFTESGAQEMRQRLIKMIGEEAYKITISTYHSFGSEIIRRNPRYFKGVNLRPINELKADSIIRELQKKLPYTSDLKSPERVKDISNLISDAKQALLRPKDIMSVALENLSFIKGISEQVKPLTDELARASLKSVDSFKKLLISEGIKSKNKSIETLSSLWNDELEAAINETLLTKKAAGLSKWKSKYLSRDHSDLYVAKGQWQNEKVIEFASLYEDYVKSLEAFNSYDYDDMILRSIEAIKGSDELRFNLQEKYLYIMLDEYQDTNLAQAELISLLTNNEVSEGQPNIMAVGDDDQAIFAFQGAKHSNMLDFTKQYAGVKQITLKDNYRSAQPIIDLSTAVASQIDERLTKLLDGVNKDFKAVRKSAASIKSLNFDNEIEEYGWLAKHLPKDDRDIAIISPEHKYLERASAYLISEGREISYERKENILDDSLIIEIITILRLIRAINDQNDRLADALAAIVVSYDFFNLSTETVWQLSWRAYDSRKPWLKVMLEDLKTRTLALTLLKLASNAKKYRYDFIIDQVLGLSDIVLNDEGIKASRSPFIEYYSDELTISRLFQSLMVIKEEFNDFNGDNMEPLMTADLIDFIDQLEFSNARLTNDYSYGKSTAKIKLMTAYAAKGLEFDRVYLLSFINEVWGPKSTNHSHISLPPNLGFIRQRAEDSDDEKLRLLYVSLTRARDAITTLSYNQDSTSKLTTPLKYLSIPPLRQETKAKVDLRPIWQQEQKLPEIKTKLKELLKKRLETYALSPTDLNTFLDIRNAGPQAFYKKVLLKYQAPMSPRVNYGSAVHETLQWLQQLLSESSKLPPLSKVLSEFELSLKRQRLLPDDYSHLKEQGRKSLSAYYEENKHIFSSDDLSEYDFRSQGLSLDGVRLSGKVDKLIIDKAAKEITIVDYKTGRGASRWENKAKLHLYKNQLYFYKLLVDNSSSFSGYKIKGALVDFVEPDATSKALFKLALPYNDSDMEHFIKLIKAVWQHINNLDFPPVSDYKPNLKDIVRFENDLINGQI